MHYNNMLKEYPSSSNLLLKYSDYVVEQAIQDRRLPSMDAPLRATAWWSYAGQRILKRQTLGCHEQTFIISGKARSPLLKSCLSALRQLPPYQIRMPDYQVWIRSTHSFALSLQWGMDSCSICEVVVATSMARLGRGQTNAAPRF